MILFVAPWMISLPSIRQTSIDDLMIREESVKLALETVIKIYIQSWGVSERKKINNIIPAKKTALT